MILPETKPIRLEMSLAAGKRISQAANDFRKWETIFADSKRISHTANDFPRREMVFAHWEKVLLTGKRPLLVAKIVC